jgi:hypothetical protein
VIVGPHEHFEDGRSIANRLAHEEECEDDARRASTKGPKSREQKLGNEDPTALVYSLLNFSRGSLHLGQ